MSYQKESFGMMDEGYFVPRGQIIDWINQLLDLNITKIQQLGAGSIYCQIVDVIHPGKVAISKVNWKAKNDYEFINNLKILQSAFEKAGVKRYVQVQKLCKAKYQDNLEFIQWLKRYYDLNCGDRGRDYNARQRRGNCAVDFSFAEKNVVPKSFNSGGQVLSKNELPVKKTNPVVPSRNIPQTKPIQKLERKIQISSPSHKVVTSKTKIQEGSGKSGAYWEGRYKQEAEKNQEYSLKIGMIEEVLKSDESSGLKISMLEQIMAIARNQPNVVNKQTHEQMQDEDEQNI